MATNLDGAQMRATAAASRLGRARGDRAQLAATLRWLRELKPIDRPAVATRRPAGPAAQ